MTCGETDFSTLVVCSIDEAIECNIADYLTASPRTTAATWASRTRRVGQPARPSPFARNNRQTLRDQHRFDAALKSSVSHLALNVPTPAVGPAVVVQPADMSSARADLTKTTKRRASIRRQDDGVLSLEPQTLSMLVPAPTPNLAVHQQRAGVLRTHIDLANRLQTKHRLRHQPNRLGPIADFPVTILPPTPLCDRSTERTVPHAVRYVQVDNIGQIGHHSRRGDT